MSVLHKTGAARIQQHAFVVMGPRVREDDECISFTNSPPNKKPGLSTGLYYFDQQSCLRGFILDRGIVAVGIGIDLALGINVGLGFGLGLGAAARALGELAFDLLDRLGFGHVLHDRDFPRQTIERRLIELTFAVGLFGLRFGAIEIAHHLGDGDDVSRIYFVF